MLILYAFFLSVWLLISMLLGVNLVKHDKQNMGKTWALKLFIKSS
jgi:hypothetical protein